MEKNEFDLYKDIQGRTNGEIYIGVVGPVRTGKSTFIKRFMELCVLPYMDDDEKKRRTIDELPQSANGKTVMTTEPKFIPRDAAKIVLDDKSDIAIRMIDCVGFMVDEAMGYMEGEEQRLINTPWSKEEMSFEEAAKIGTNRVINDHSTIAVMITTDGSLNELKRENYIEAEKMAVFELKKTGKPYLIILNCVRPHSRETIELAKRMEKEYEATVIPLNCEQMQITDVKQILKTILYEFPIERIDFEIPKWTEMLELENNVKSALVDLAKRILARSNKMNDIHNLFNDENIKELKNETVNDITINNLDLSTGIVKIGMEVDEKFYYMNLSEMVGIPIVSQQQMIKVIKELSEVRAKYEKVREAIESVEQKGYGVVMPELEDIRMDEPVLIQHGSKYGVKMNAVSPSIHLIRANIETEVAPIVGSKEQAEDLIEYIKSEQNEKGIWTTNIFGKSIGELMEDGIKNKIMQMDDECQIKLQDTMQKIVNDINGGMVCIII